MNFRKSRILHISWDQAQKVKISVMISQVPKGRILNITWDIEQQLMIFIEICGLEGAGVTNT